MPSVLLLSVSGLTFSIVGLSATALIGAVFFGADTSTFAVSALGAMIGSFIAVSAGITSFTAIHFGSCRLWFWHSGYRFFFLFTQFRSFFIQLMNQFFAVVNSSFKIIGKIIASDGQVITQRLQNVHIP